MFYIDLLFKLNLIKRSSIFLFSSELNKNLEILFFFKNSSYFVTKYMIDITSFDNVGFRNRFKVCYNLASLNFDNLFFIFFSVFFLNQVASVGKLFTSCIWMEREVFDMFGIFFLNNWDMRKILTDYTFFGFPLRKDFPLSGFLEVLFCDKLKSNFEVFIELMQELRFFTVSTPLEFWEDFFEFKL